MPHFWCVDAVQANTEFSAIPCDESQRIPIGYIPDESFDSAIICGGGNNKCREENKDEKDGDVTSMVNR